MLVLITTGCHPIDETTKGCRRVVKGWHLCDPFPDPTASFQDMVFRSMIQYSRNAS
jgi:hypothetical protein